MLYDLADNFGSWWFSHMCIEMKPKLNLKEKSSHCPGIPPRPGSVLRGSLLLKHISLSGFPISWNWVDYKSQRHLIYRMAALQVYLVKFRTYCHLRLIKDLIKRYHIYGRTTQWISIHAFISYLVLVRAAKSYHYHNLHILLLKPTHFHTILATDQYWEAYKTSLWKSVLCLQKNKSWDYCSLCSKVPSLRTIPRNISLVSAQWWLGSSKHWSVFS